jgi:hypothetical protein
MVIFVSRSALGTRPKPGSAFASMRDGPASWIAGSDVRFARILLEESPLADERNFSASLVRAARVDARDLRPRGSPALNHAC